MKSKTIVNIVANFVLVAVVTAIAAAGFYGNAAVVFSADDCKPIYRGDASHPYVTLMINVYWGTEYLDSMLETLAKHNVKTTFFVGGYWVGQNPEALQKILSYGHEVGNHGYYHKDHSKLSYDANVSEIVTNGKLVFETCGVQMTLFAPPSGAFNNDTLKAAYNNGYKTIMWSRDTIDWRDKDSSLVFQRATKDVGNGELILMHPTAHTALALDKILTYYEQNGLTVVPVGRNIFGE